MRQQQCIGKAIPPTALTPGVHPILQQLKVGTTIWLPESAAAVCAAAHTAERNRSRRRQLASHTQQ